MVLKKLRIGVFPADLVYLSTRMAMLVNNFLAVNNPSHLRIMAGMKPPTKRASDLALKYGAALKRLRLAQGYTQDAAALAANISQATWEKYENARNNALLGVDVQQKVTQALGLSIEDLSSEIIAIDAGIPQHLSAKPLIEKPTHTTIQSTGRAHLSEDGKSYYDPSKSEHIDLSDYFSDNDRVLQIVSDDAAPYAEPGSFVTYRLYVAPRRGQMIVIKLSSGPFLIRRYLRNTGTTIETVKITQHIIDGKTAYIEETDNYALREVEGTHPIKMRID